MPIMPYPQSNRNLAPLATTTTGYCSTIYSNSTSCTEVSSPAVSSRILYHDSFGQRPETSRSLPPLVAIDDCPPSRHHHTKSAETYHTITSKQSDSSWHFGKNMNSHRLLGQQQQMDSSQHFKMNGEITTEEEFDALPLAVRRKFFSTLERLRFAQNGAHVNEPTFRHCSQTDRPSTRASTHPERRVLSKKRSINNTRRSASISYINHSKSSPRPPRKLVIYDDTFPSIAPPLETPDSPRTWFMTLPEKIQQSQFSREEQIALAGRLREGRGNRGRGSVILDAADEAMWKASYHRKTNHNTTRDAEKVRKCPSAESMGSMHGLEKNEGMVGGDGNENEDAIIDAFDAYDSFRWLDEESDLDLSLHNHLDDYHANLANDFLRSSPSANRRPSFRRHLSISKIPFGGNMSTHNSIPSPPSPKSPKLNRASSHWAATPTKGYESKKSRALSLMPLSKASSTKHSEAEGHDIPSASHWQDPDARLKLRVYLASPQKFDEAIEFGFPSLDRDTVSTPLGDNKENRSPFSHKQSRESSRFRHGEGGSHGTATTFLNDDEDMIYGDEDDASMLDPDSPKTPLENGDPYTLAQHRTLTSNPESHSHNRFASKGSSSLSSSARASRERNGDDRDYSHLGITKPVLHKRADTESFVGLGEGRGYMQQLVGPGNREMTLRMTLTRPDLRTDAPSLAAEKDNYHKPPSVATAVKSRQPSVDKSSVVGEKSAYGMGISNLGWQHAATHTTVTAAKLDGDGWDEKYDVVGMRGPFGGVDGWGEEKEEGGVVKRFWKKVSKSSQKKL